MNFNKSDIISTDEDWGLRIESFSIIKIRGVSTNYKLYFCLAIYYVILYKILKL